MRTSIYSYLFNINSGLKHSSRAFASCPTYHRQKNSWFTDVVNEAITKLLSPAEYAMYTRGGYYSREVVPGVHVLALNTNIYSPYLTPSISGEWGSICDCMPRERARICLDAWIFHVHMYLDTTSLFF